MDMFPHTVTLYNVSVETDPATLDERTINHITVLEGGSSGCREGKNVNESGLVDADSVTLYIPANMSATDGVTGEKKRYVGPVEFWNGESRDGLWTLSPGQKHLFVKGNAVHPDWSNQKISAAYDYVYDVKTVDFKGLRGRCPTGK